MGEIIAGAGLEPHPRPALAGDDPEAVVLDFMQPFTAGGKLIGFAWQARRDEPGREGNAVTCRRNGAAIVPVNSPAMA
jgi:hypothetical protein